ncbi:hypothetical protein [Streptomyces bohaiensis]|uniref:hypothetical protein n=1 Tax=Streptomyces bohaiensis TaxID=1431344 RepID=UPI003B7A068E
MHESTSRSAELRTTAVASAVALALALPLAFATSGTQPGDPSRAAPPTATDVEPDTGPDTGESTRGEGHGAAGTAETDCGPAISAPEGVEARTCLVTEGADTWARVYYRNGSGEPLRGGLTVHDPAGGTVEVRCEVPATAARGVCETPRVPTVDDSAVSFYSATAELAAPGAEGDPLRAAAPRS